MKNIKYAIVMEKKKLNNQLYILIPVSMVEGSLEMTNGYKFYTNDGKTFLDLYNPKSLINETTTKLTAYTISQEQLMEKYPTYTLEKAKKDFFEQIYNTTNIAFYIPKINATGILPLYLQKMVDKLNDSLGESKNVKLNPKTDINFLPVDENGYPLSPYEKELLSSDIDTQPKEVDFHDFFKELLKTEDVSTIHKVLEQLMKGNYQFNEIISTLSFSNLIEESKKNNFKQTTIYDIFSNSCKRILYSDNKEEIRNLLEQTIDFFTNLYCEFPPTKDNLGLVSSSCSYLEDLTDWYKQIIDKNLDENSIHKEIAKLEYLEKGNIKELHKNYQTVLSIANTTAQDNQKKERPKDDTTIIDIIKAKKYLDEQIVGQENAKKSLICAILNHQIANQMGLKMPTSCLLVGPTGSGKTLLAETIANYLNIPSIVFDMTQLTAAGYIGDSITDSLKRLLIKANNDIKKAEQGMIIFDEIDKKGSDSNKDISGKGALNALLPYLDGRTYYLDMLTKQVPFQTNQLMIVATGSFSEILDKKNPKSFSNQIIGFSSSKQELPKKEYITKSEIIEYSGLPKELVARIPNIIMLNAHTEKSLKEILTRKKISPLYKNAKILKHINVNFSWDNSYIDAVAKKAFELGNGARSLNNIVEESIFAARWEALANPHQYIGFKVTQDTVEDYEKALLYGLDGQEYQLKEILAERKKQPEEDIKKLIKVGRK